MKERIDKLLVDLGHFDSRERAKKNIMAGKVFVNNFVIDKPGFLISIDDQIVIKEDENPFVSRGGLKLDKSIQRWGIKLKNKICMDIGASTGGFTDVMLKNGAKKVYSVDVGYGQLDWRLRNSPQVVNLERTNIRYLKNKKVQDRIDFFSIDVSFISLKLIFPVLASFANDKFECVALVKPQFEVGKSEVGKKGVVREKESHVKSIRYAIEYAKSNGLYVRSIDFSPIRGPKGNIEFLMLISNLPNDLADEMLSPETTVELAHQCFYS